MSANVSLLNSANSIQRLIQESLGRVHSPERSYSFHKNSLGGQIRPGDGTPLRGAFIRFRPGFKNSLREKLYQLWGAGDILAAINSWRPGPFWSAKMGPFFRRRRQIKLT